ncbi:MAG: hypothetical protein E7326_09350 [Clostridiales bacterium]|nr:hypothetical protein [Clostridiales bacterium]
MRRFICLVSVLSLLLQSAFAQMPSWHAVQSEAFPVEDVSLCESVSVGDQVLFYGSKGASAVDAEDPNAAPWNDAFAALMPLGEKEPWIYTYNTTLPGGTAKFMGGAILEEQILLLKSVADMYAEENFSVTVLDHAGELICEHALPAEFRPVASCASSHMLILSGFRFDKGLRYPALMAYGTDGDILWQFVLKEHAELDPARLNTYSRIACDDESIWVQWENAGSSSALHHFSAQGALLSELPFSPSRFYANEILICGEYVMVRGGEQHLPFVLYMFDPVINNWRILRTPLDENEYDRCAFSDGNKVHFVTQLNQQPCRLFTFDPSAYSMDEAYFTPGDLYTDISYGCILQDRQMLLCGLTKNDALPETPCYSLWKQEP